MIQEAADRAARKIAALGHVEPSVLQDAVDRVGVTETVEEPAGDVDLLSVSERESDPLNNTKFHRET